MTRSLRVESATTDQRAMPGARNSKRALEPSGVSLRAEVEPQPRSVYSIDLEDPDAVQVTPLTDLGAVAGSSRTM